MKVLAIGAHPDDIEIFMYGLLSVCKKRKDEISLLIATDGSAGGDKSSINLIKTRKKETIKGIASSETMIGGLGNDIMDGKAGNDILLGASTEEGGGRKEKAILTGGKGKNTFVLGSDSGILYDDGKKGSGKKDYALITDFDPKRDKLQLHGASSDYHFKGKEYGEIYYDSNDNGKFDRKDELIAKCDDMTEKDFEKALDNAIFKAPFNGI